MHRVRGKTTPGHSTLKPSSGHLWTVLVATRCGPSGLELRMGANKASQSALVLVKGVAALGDKIFVSTLTEICKLSGVSFHDMCQEHSSGS